MSTIAAVRGAAAVCEARTVLFLQGPLSGLYARIGDHLRERGLRVLRVHLCFGDWLHWQRPGGCSFRGRVEEWDGYVQRFLDEHAVTDLVLHGECRIYHRIAAERARERGIRVFATELGYLRPDWMTIERDATASGSRFPRDPDAIRRIAARCPPLDLAVRYPTSFWRVAAPDVVWNLANVVLRPLYPHYRRHTLDHPVVDYSAGLVRLLTQRLRDARARRTTARLHAAAVPRYVLALQLDGDFQIRERSRFSGMAEVIREVLDSFAAHAAPDALLAVKSHPLDNGLRRLGRVVHENAAALGVGARVCYVDGGRLAPLLDGARGMVSVNSSAAIEAMRLGCPVMALADAVYRVPGLAFDGELDAFWRESAAPDATLLDAFLRALVATVQVRGTIYDRRGQEAAAKAMADRIAGPTGAAAVS